MLGKKKKEGNSKENETDQKKDGSLTAMGANATQVAKGQKKKQCDG